MIPTSFKIKITTVLDRYIGRWNNVWFNVGLGFLFVAIALFMPGWARDVWMLSAGANFGYAFMWLISPRFTKARQREFQAQMDMMLAKTLLEHSTQVWGSIARIVTQEDDDDEKRPGRLQ